MLRCLVVMPKVATTGKNISQARTLKPMPLMTRSWLRWRPLGRPAHSQAVMTGTKPSNYGMVEIVIQEKEQNKRVILSAKAIDDVAGTPAKPRSIHSLRTTTPDGAIAAESWPQNRKMQYDVMVPGGPAISGVIPYSDQGQGVWSPDK